MSTTAFLLVAIGFCLAFVNGANDVSKGIATLIGSGVSDRRRALLWGTLWTGVGGILGGVAAARIVATFGSGFLSPGTVPTLAAAAAMLIGAASWVLVATRMSLPVSTTHAILGSIAGVGVVAYGFAGINWSTVGGKIIVPLLVSPAVSLVLVALLLRARPGATPARDCVCVEVTPMTLMSQSPGGPVALMASGAGGLSVVTGSQQECEVENARALRLNIDHVHWATSATMSFARGLNDAPKIVALVLATTLLEGTAPGIGILFIVVASGMALGSLVGGWRVTQVLATRVTPMDHREGFCANLVTAALVTAGSVLGWPMSTTHVSAGGIVGAGLQRASLNTKTLRDMGLAWVATLPASALMGITAYIAGTTFFS